MSPIPRAAVPAVVALLMAWPAARAPADDTPVVTILPGVLTPADGPAPAGAAQQHLDRPLPAGRAFELQVPVGQGVEASGVLQVWPAVVQACGADAEPPSSGPQVYVLGMRLEQTGPARVLAARVPPLQVGQPFCLLARTRVGLSRKQVAAIVERVAVGLGDRFERKYLVERDQAFPEVKELKPELVAAFTQEIEHLTKVPAASRDVRKAAWLAADGFLVSKGHLQYRARARIHRELAVKQAELSGRLEAVRKDLASRPPLAPLSSPVVYHDGVLIAVLDLLQADVKLATLNKAAAQLAARDEGAKVDWPKAWQAELAKIAAELGKTAASEKGIFLSTAASDLTEMVREGKIASPDCLDVWDAEHAKLACLSSFQRDPASFDAALAKAVAAQVDDLASDWTGEAAERYQGWIKDLAQVIELEQQIAKTTTRLEQARAGLEAARTQAREDFETAFGADAVVGAVVPALQEVSASVAGRGKVSVKGNYASLDLGLGLGWPAKGKPDGPTFVPTIGLNIYFAPVDRVVPLGELVGDGYDVWLQRLSLTVGISLTEPGVAGREVKPMLLSRYPFVALGYRTSHFVRLVLGVAFYKLLDANPASAAHELGFMPFIGVSLDVDLVHLFTEAVD